MLKVVPPEWSAEHDPSNHASAAVCQIMDPSFCYTLGHLHINPPNKTVTSIVWRVTLIRFSSTTTGNFPGSRVRTFVVVTTSMVVGESVVVASVVVTASVVTASVVSGGAVWHRQFIITNNIIASER